MTGSITYEFSGDARDYRVHISREGELECGDLEVIAALLQDDIKLKKRLASGEITSTPADPSGIRQLHSRWSN
jgi:hypothetical protein